MRISIKIAILLLVFSGMCALAATAEPSATEPGHGLTITVEVFSGRPNPAFVLDDVAAIQHLRNAFSQLPAETPDGSQAAAFGHLGYRGIVIDNPQGVNGIPRYVQVLDGLVLVRDKDGSAPRYLRDNGSLEKRCLALAVEQGIIGELIEAGLVPAPSTM